MKLLMITDLYPPHHVGGYEIRCKETAEELRRRGHEVEILTSTWEADGSEVENQVHRLLESNPLNNPREVAFRDFLKLRRRYYQLKWVFNNRRNYDVTRELEKQIKPDVAFIWNMDSVGVAPLLASQHQDIHTVFSIGDFWLLRLKTELCDESAPLKRKFRNMLEGIGDFGRLDLRHLLAISTKLKQNYIKGGFPEANLTVIPRGIQSSLVVSEDRLCDNLDTSKRTQSLLFIGRIVSEKAPDVAVRALSLLVNKYGMTGIRLDLIGEGRGAYASELRQMVSNLNLDQNVRFLGWLEHDRILDLYLAYDVLLFPSRWEEPGGGTILEAMARGLPVIASSRGGALDVIRDGKNGLMVPADDPTALAEAILRLIQNDNLVQKIRHEAIKTIRDRFTLERVVDLDLQYIERVLASRPLPLDHGRPV